MAGARSQHPAPVQPECSRQTWPLLRQRSTNPQRASRSRKRRWSSKGFIKPSVTYLLRPGSPYVSELNDMAPTCRCGASHHSGCDYSFTCCKPPVLEEICVEELDAACTVGTLLTTESDVVAEMFQLVAGRPKQTEARTPGQFNPIPSCKFANWA